MTTQHTSEIYANMAEVMGVTVDPDLPRIDPEQDTRSRLRRARAELWQRICPEAMRASDWAHPRLAPWSAQIGLVRGWNPPANGRGLLLCGPTGRGKTRSLWALAKRLMCEEGRDVGIWKAVDWFARLSHYLAYGVDDAGGFVRACSTRPILIIDDLGQQAVERSRESWARSWLFDLLDERLSNARPTIVTTNLSANQIAGSGAGDDIRGEPLVRRLLDLCEVVHFTTAAERAAKTKGTT